MFYNSKSLYQRVQTMRKWEDEGKSLLQTNCTQSTNWVKVKANYTKIFPSSKVDLLFEAWTDCLVDCPLTNWLSTGNQTRQEVPSLGYSQSTIPYGVEGKYSLNWLSCIEKHNGWYSPNVTGVLNRTAALQSRARYTGESHTAFCRNSLLAHMEDMVDCKAWYLLVSAWCFEATQQNEFCGYQMHTNLFQKPMARWL